MRDNITGKSILLIGDPFYGYCAFIKEQLLLLGAKSVRFIEAPFYTGSFRDDINLSTVVSWLKDPKVRIHWTQQLLNELGDEVFDTLFVVQKMPFKKSFVDELRARNPQLRSILFLWDTFRTQQARYKDYLPKFDKVYTFDKDDATTYHLTYFPDFYIEEEAVPISQCKYDVAFVGTMDADDTSYRGKILAAISELCQQEGLNSFFYLRFYNYNQSGSLKLRLKRFKYRNYMKKVERLQKYGFMHESALPLSDYNRIMANTKAVIDISHRHRQGLTINAITALANGRKLITTNQRIKDESFYDPQMICVIDEEAPVIDAAFLRSPYRPVDMSFLRMDHWLKHIVNEQSND